VSRPPGPDEAGPARRPPALLRREVLDGLSAELEAVGVESARHEAERLVSHVLGLSRSELLLGLDLPIEPDDARGIAEASKLRMSGVPLQHIEGTVAFRAVVLVCDERALVPRPETEQLVQPVVDWVQRVRSAGGVRRVLRRSGGSAPPLSRVLDIGTGSGAIALSLLREGVAKKAVGVDVSRDALEQAAENARLLGLEARLELRCVETSPWEAVGSDELFDAIVSNPPYVEDADLETLSVEVRHHDPREALSGGADGLDVVRLVVAGANPHLTAGGAVFLEVGSRQGERVRELLAEAADWSSIEVVADLSGHDRFVIARV
jgi:release factor glutamine methyltransferase